jgi:hypothetical protein
MKYTLVLYNEKYEFGKPVMTTEDIHVLLWEIQRLMVQGYINTHTYKFNFSIEQEEK